MKNSKLETRNSKLGLSQRATERIRREHIKPRPLGSIFIEQVAYAALGLVIFATVVLGVRLIGTWLHLSGFAEFLKFGALGLRAFAGGFPYGFLLLTAGAFTGLLAILRHYDVSYRWPFALLALTLLGGAVGLGVGLTNQETNTQITYERDQSTLSALTSTETPLPEAEFSHLSRHAIVGRVREIQAQLLRIEARNHQVDVLINDETKYPAGKPVVDDQVRALVERDTQGTPTAKVILIRRGGQTLRIQIERKVLPAE